MARPMCGQFQVFSSLLKKLHFVECFQKVVNVGTVRMTAPTLVADDLGPGTVRHADQATAAFEIAESRVRDQRVHVSIIAMPGILELATRPAPGQKRPKRKPPTYIYRYLRRRQTIAVRTRHTDPNIAWRQFSSKGTLRE